MFDVVIQGPVYDYLPYVIDSYRKPYVNKIIYSGWTTDPLIKLPEDITYIRNSKPTLPGQGNINLQTTTTLAGLNVSLSPLALKTRSDMCIKSEDLDRFYDFYLKHNKILTTGISTQYALYTLDFIFFGKTEDLKALFNCPYNPSLNYYPDIRKGVIPETYLISNYISKFEAKVDYFCKHTQDYLLLDGSNYNETLKTGLTLIEKYFTPLPCIELLWLKHYKNYRSMRQILDPRTTDYYSIDW